jgi:hypothetical protein
MQSDERLLSIRDTAWIASSTVRRQQGLAHGRNDAAQMAMGIVILLTLGTLLGLCWRRRADGRCSGLGRRIVRGCFLYGHSLQRQDKRVGRALVFLSMGVA